MVGGGVRFRNVCPRLVFSSPSSSDGRGGLEDMSPFYLTWGFRQREPPVWGVLCLTQPKDWQWVGVGWGAVGLGRV